jgi:hypothetical protein
MFFAKRIDPFGKTVLKATATVSLPMRDAHEFLKKPNCCKPV